MKKGVILEVDDRFLTLLTPEGEFLHARKHDKQYALGEEILFAPIQVERNGKKYFSLANKLFSLKTLVTSAAALLLFIASLIPFSTKREVYAYMSIDVNPSLELGVNKNMEVIELSAYNNEGEEIIAGIDEWEKKDVSVITDILIDEMETQGYLEQNREVIISTVSIEKSENKLEEKMAEEVIEIQKVVAEENLVLNVVEGTETERKAAKKLGLTTGKYKQVKLKVKKQDRNSTDLPNDGKNDDKSKDIPSNPHQKSAVPGEKDNQHKPEDEKENKKNPNYHHAPGKIKENEKNAKDSGMSEDKQQTNTDNWVQKKQDGDNTIDSQNNNNKNSNKNRYDNRIDEKKEHNNNDKNNDNNNFKNEK